MSPTSLLSQLRITHHGAVDGVTGSCHQLTLPGGDAVLVDCGLFQGAETSSDGATANKLEIGFPIDKLRALFVTHVHIDHVGRVPYLLAAGFKGPIYCSEPSGLLLPMVLEDALKVGFTRDKALIARVITQLQKQIIALPYKAWQTVLPADAAQPDKPALKLRLQPAGHILGSAYLELDVSRGTGKGIDKAVVVFSGDLGAPYTPLLPAPQSPARADILVIESTYGDRVHESRKDRRQRLQAICEHAFSNGGTLLIPAFSIGRTQELLYELEEIIHRNRQRPAAKGVNWGDLDIVVDSPLAADFTAGYGKLKAHWDLEARRKFTAGRHPLAFEQVTTIDEHSTHLRTVEYLAKTARPAIVIAASGMCSGGRIVNYLKAMLGDPRHDVLFCGYQAAGTPGRDILQHAPKPGKPGGYVMLDGQRIDIRAGIHQLGGFSAHADQKDLLNFISRIPTPPKQVRIVHGDEAAKATLAQLIKSRKLAAEVHIP